LLLLVEAFQVCCVITNSNA